MGLVTRAELLRWDVEGVLRFEHSGRQDAKDCGGDDAW